MIETEEVIKKRGRLSKNNDGIPVFQEMFG